MTPRLDQFTPITVTTTVVAPNTRVVQFGPLSIAMLEGGLLVPAQIPFIFTEQHVDILMDIMAGERVVLTGHTGCGKTTALEQMAARIGVGVVVINMSEGADASTLIGSYVARKAHPNDTTSSTIFVDGTLTQAMKSGDWVIMDEMDFAQPGVMTILNGITADSKFFINHEIAGTETIKIHQNFRLMGTANTIGPMAEFRHLYSGTPPMNPAQLERYRVHVIDYLPLAEEINAIVAAVQLKLQHFPVANLQVSKETVAPFVEVGQMIRELFIQGEISTPVSTRGLIHWVSIAIRNTSVYANTQTSQHLIKVILRAAAPAILNKMSADDALRVTEMILATNNFKVLKL